MNKLLKGYPEQDVKNFIEYIGKLQNDPKQSFIREIGESRLAHYFKKVFDEGLKLDGKHVTINSLGLSYDYIAYKNKMLIAYPESKVDVQLVYTGDKFTVSKDSGMVTYKHDIASPFEQKDTDIVGAYCVIKNKRGEFITTMSKDDLAKHRQIAKTSYIWDKWKKEMCLKTVIKKACKQHFADIYEAVEEDDNVNYDLEKAVDVSGEHIEAVSAINTIDDLREYYIKHKGSGKDLDKLIQQRKVELTNTNENN